MKQWLIDWKWINKHEIKLVKIIPRPSNHFPWEEMTEEEVERVWRYFKEKTWPESIDYVLADIAYFLRYIRANGGQL